MKPETLVQKLKNGDNEVLKLVYELFYKSTFQAALFITSDPNLAEDAVHETFLKLRDKIDQLEDPSKLGAWLCRIAANIARDLMSDRVKCTSLVEPLDKYQDKKLISPETVLLDKEVKQLVRQVIDRLRPGYRLIIYLKYYEDMSVNEISKTLGLPVGTVKSRLFHARRELRKLIEPKTGFNRHKLEIKRPEGVS